MISNSDLNNEPTAPFGLSPNTRRILVFLVAAPLLFVGFAFLAGYLSAGFEHDVHTTKYYVILAALVFAIALASFGTWKLWPHGVDPEPVAPSTRNANRIIYWMIAIGTVLGIYLALTDDMSGSRLFSNEPIGITSAVIGLLTWLVIVPVLTWSWWRTIDEHESAAYTEGALIAAHVYVIGAPAWWLAARAGWLPPQDPMIGFAIVGTVWAIVWLKRRYFS